MFLFLLLAIVAIIASVLMITARNSVHSALFLIVTFFCLAVLYLTLNAELLAALQIVVYAGAIMVLFLFVITLLNPGHEEDSDQLRYQRPVAVALSLALLVEVALLLNSDKVRAVLGDFPPAKPFAEQVTATITGAGGSLGNTQAVGAELFTTYLLPFELTSILLLLAVVGAIVLAKRQVR
jgi:NADH-quinone oxidoreductase subunit J